MKVSTILPLLFTIANAGLLPRSPVKISLSAHAAISDTDIANRPTGVLNDLPSLTQTCTVTIPFLNVGETFIDQNKNWPDYDGPRVMVAVDDVDVYSSGIQLDTGSTGMTIGKQKWEAQFGKDFSNDVQTPKTNKGFKYLTSSDRLYKGFWVNVKLTFKSGPGGNPLLEAHVPVLVYNQTQKCTQAPDANGNCPYAGEYDNELTGVYLGVGFGRRENGNIQLTPEKNPLISADAVWGEASGPCASGSYRNGYIVTKTGVTWGLTDDNTMDFKFHTLQKFPGTTFQYDWAMAPACIGVNSLACRAGQVLADTGVKQAYISHPDVPTDKSLRQPPKTNYTLAIPNGDASMAYYFYSKQLDTAHAVEPTTYEVTRTTGANARVYMNPGSHFFNAFETLFDADQGYYGINALDIGGDEDEEEED